MYVLYGSEPMVLERVRDAIPSDEHGIATLSWKELIDSAPQAHCLLIAMRWLAGDLSSRLRIAASGDQAVPIILITTRDAENARTALRSGATRIVWLEDVKRELRELLLALRVTPILERAAELLNGSRRFSEPLRGALRAACQAERPLRSVGELATLVQRDRRTLWQHWHRALGGASAPRLEDFLDWILLIHATHRKTPLLSWARVARALGTSEHTLARIAARLAGMTLSQLALSGHRLLEERFLDSAVRPLLGTADKVG